jgi:hypothetical protein
VKSDSLAFGGGARTVVTFGVEFNNLFIGLKSFDEADGMRLLPFVKDEG